MIRFCIFTILFILPAYAAFAGRTLPVITIIIDDIGYRKQHDLQALALPGPVAYAILPYAPHTSAMALLADQRGKEILLHQPMQATQLEKNKYLGPGALTLNMTRDEFIRTINVNMNNLPHLIGVNNHMGSLLTRHPVQMQWLMESIKAYSRFYLDSLTSKESVAGAIARKNGVVYLTRDVFLDNNRDPAYIRAQFAELVKIAKQKGSAIAIGHPYKSTIGVLSDELLHLGKYGVELVGIKSLMRIRAGRQEPVTPVAGAGDPVTDVTIHSINPDPPSNPDSQTAPKSYPNQQ